MIFNYKNNQDLYYLYSKYKSYNTERSKKLFYLLFDYMAKTEIITGKGRYNGQSKSEFQKNYKRIKDIVDKSEGDENKAIKLSETQANRITDEWKAINRAMAAKEMGYDYIFEVFFQRAYELGSVSKQEKNISI
jgi:hypothetical protein